MIPIMIPATATLRHGQAWVKTKDGYGYEEVNTSKFWVTQAGEKIPISKLEDQHLLNILNKFKHKGKNYKKKYGWSALIAEAKRRNLEELWIYLL